MKLKHQMKTDQLITKIEFEKDWDDRIDLTQLYSQLQETYTITNANGWQNVKVRIDIYYGYEPGDLSVDGFSVYGDRPETLAEQATRKAEEKKHRERKKAQEEARRLVAEQHDIEEYARLKTKFEGS